MKLSSNCEDYCLLGHDGMQYGGHTVYHTT